MDNEQSGYHHQGATHCIGRAALCDRRTVGQPQRQVSTRPCAIVEAAKAAGADAVKLQTYRPDTITLNADSEDFRDPWRPVGWPHGCMTCTRRRTCPGTGMRRCSNMRASLASPSSARPSTHRRRPAGGPGRTGLQDRLLRSGRPAADQATSPHRQADDHLDRHGRRRGDRRSDCRRLATGGCRELALLHCVSGYPAPAGRLQPAHAVPT
jgi:hypothetical protein